MSAWYYISVFIHVLCAAFWIGGMMFLPLVILPAIKTNKDRIAILYKTGIRFRFFGWIALTLLLVSGLTNMHFRGLPLTLDYMLSSNYGQLVSYKFIIFIIILLVSGIHDFFIGKQAIDQMQQSGSNKLRKMARWSGRINLLLAVSAVFIGILLSRGGF